MTFDQLLSELEQKDIRLEARGDKLRYSPGSAMTPDLLNCMKVFKSELLDMVRCDPVSSGINAADGPQVREAAIDGLESTFSFPIDVIEVSRGANVEWADSNDREREAIQWCETSPGHEVQEQLEIVLAEWGEMVMPSASTSTQPSEPRDLEGSVDVAFVDFFEIEAIEPPPPCAKCGTLELWQTWTGDWRCVSCDPPAMAQQFRRWAAKCKRH